MQHPHDQLIRAWLDGRAVQYYDADRGGIWIDLEPPHMCSKLPHFYAHGQYRLKPVILRFRVGLNTSLEPFAVRSVMAEHAAERAEWFDRWIGDWQEVVL